MSEPISGAAASAAGWKILASPGAIGVLGGAAGFIFLWPKDAKEGFSRIAASAMSSHFFGDAVLQTIMHFAPWITPKEMQAGAYLIAALPAWWILGALIKYLSKGRDIQEMARDAKEIL